MRLRSLALALLAAGVMGCGSSGGGTPTAPSATAPPLAAVTPTLSGTYSGNVSDSSGAGTMTWTPSQAGNTVSGTVTATTPRATVAFSGSLSGTFSGATLTFTIAVPAGGVSAHRSCTMTIEGTATNVTAATIAGTYRGSSTCAPAFDSGRFTLTR